MLVYMHCRKGKLYICTVNTTELKDDYVSVSSYREVYGESNKQNIVIDYFYLSRCFVIDENFL